MSTDQLIAYLAQYIPLRDIEKHELKHRVIEKRIKRRQFILQQNDVCKYYTFVVSGCFKMYGVDDSGAEHNLQFAAENDWIADISSFHSGKPSGLYIEAIEPGDSVELDHHIPAQADHPFRAKLTSAFRGKLTTPNT